ncbi:MAG: helix-turn-helix domain-containing protein [Pyrobaculum arsenaticum]|uniref:Transcriptional regulator, Fis family n=2 Tax=Pyrobaculum arsenaticum TaxID=121277 RepID=A4WJQ9_PYRAR|nr:helix-turn-helix domain-containing protein [Pyrobaculum arsenaticum]ABP50626.1 transcriptional regulator, Fis family [Pyrobaculum arsenaticum DSM 13514]MCY0889554.1 helix-turn-helix domain-containing protein [Pyrobaculum arsenaticum]NYR14442.1 helix-turn-helix domain-containing protein [Pyrobaculum arsenaticum]
MLVFLNLTAPPLLLLLLPAALVGNYTLPAPPLSDVAAFTTAGEPLPTWVLNNTLYVLQNGAPAVAVYVPRYENSSGVYTVTVKADKVVVQAPPGVMIEDFAPLPTNVVVNKTGLYLYFTGEVRVKYYFFSIITIKPPPTPTATQTTTTTTAPPSPTPPPTSTQPSTSAPTGTSPPGTTTTTTPAPAAGVDMWPVVGLAVAAAVAAGVYFLFKRRPSGGDCGELTDVDRVVLQALANMGGSAERTQLQNALGVPKTTLHRHLHKLAKYGYVRLVQEGGRQRVELLRKC